MPAGVVKDEHDGAINAGPGLSREAFKQRRDERLRSAVVHIPEGLARRRRDEGGGIEPVEAMMAMRDRPFDDGRWARGLLARVHQNVAVVAYHYNYGFI